MNSRSTWIGAIVSICVILSMALFGFNSGPASAATAKHGAQSHVGKGKKKGPAKTAACTKKNKQVGIIKYSDWQFPDTLNPYQEDLNVDGEISDGMFDDLFIYNHSGKLIPDVAANIPSLGNHQITNGGKTVIVKLKHGVHFSNGSEVTSQTVRFSWQIANDKVTGPYCAGITCDSISRIDTPNKYTAVVHFKSVNPAAVNTALEGIVLYPTKWPGAWNGDPHAAAVKLELPTYNFENTSYPTDGPYHVASFIPNDRIQLVPMKYYSALGCGARLQQALFVFYATKPGMIAAAASGQTDMTDNYTFADLKDLQSHANVFKTVVEPGLQWEHFELNQDPTYNGKTNVLTNRNVRVALALALDKLGLIRSALGVTPAVARSIESWNMWTNTKQVKAPFTDTSIVGQWDPIAKKYQTNVGHGQALADAKKLIANSPCAHGCTINFTTTSANPVRQAQEAVAANSWQRIGVTLSPVYVPATKFFSGVWADNGTLDHGNYQIAQYTNGIVTVDPSLFKEYMDPRFCDRKHSSHSAIYANEICETDPAISRAFDAAGSTFDKSVRAKEYSLIQTAFNQNAWWIMLYYRGSLETNDSKNKAFATSLVTERDTWNMFAWNTGKE